MTSCCCLQKTLAQSLLDTKDRHILLMVPCLTYRIVDISAAAAPAPAEAAPALAPAPMSFAALPLLSPTDALAAALRGDNIPTSRQLTPSEVLLHSLV